MQRIRDVLQGLNLLYGREIYEEAQQDRTQEKQEALQQDGLEDAQAQYQPDSDARRDPPLDWRDRPLAAISEVDIARIRRALSRSDTKGE